jgi:hypothetical protein
VPAPSSHEIPGGHHGFVSLDELAEEAQVVGLFSVVMQGLRDLPRERQLSGSLLLDRATSWGHAQHIFEGVGHFGANLFNTSFSAFFSWVPHIHAVRRLGHHVLISSLAFTAMNACLCTSLHNCRAKVPDWSAFVHRRCQDRPLLSVTRSCLTSMNDTDSTRMCPSVAPTVVACESSRLLCRGSRVRLFGGGAADQLQQQTHEGLSTQDTRTTEYAPSHIQAIG